MALATLSVDLVAKVASFEADLKRVARTAEQQSDRMAAAFGLARAGIAGLVAGLSVGAVTAFFNNIVNGVDSLNDLKDATGASIENLSALEDIAARTGTSMETVGGAVLKLNKTLADAKPGNDAAAALDALGLSAKDLKALDPAEALRQVAVALSGFADDGNKARLTQELFGKSLREVAPLLKDLSEAGQLNATVTTAQAEAAETFNKQLFALQKNAVDAARSLTGPLIEAINETIEKFRDGASAGESFFQTLRREQLALLGIGTGAPEQLQQLQVELTAIDAALKRSDISDLRRADLEKKRIGRLETINRLQAESARAFKPADNYGDAFKPSAPFIGPSAPAIGPSAGSKAEKAGRTPFAFSGPILDQAGQDAIKALEQTDTAKLAALREQLTALISIRAAGGDTDRVDEALKSTVEQITRLDPVAQKAAESAKKLQAILSQTPSAQFADVLSSIELLNRAFEDGGLSADKWAEAIQVATAKLPAAIEEPIKAVSTFAEQAGRNIQDALGSSLESVLSGNFRSIGKLWSDLVTRMAAQAAAAQLNSYLFGDSVGGGKGGGGGALASLFASFGGFFASGGTLGAGKWGIAGEAGAEIVRGPASITPMGAMGGTTVVQHYHINGDVSPQTVALIRAEGSRTKADILRSMRTGGNFAGAY